MARMAAVFLVGLLCGALILKVGLYQSRVEPASAASQSASDHWQLAAFPPREAAESIIEELPNLPAQCDVELTTMGDGTVLLLYACP